MAYPVKLLMSWNIKPGREEEYFRFIMEDFPSPFLDAVLQISDAWYAIYGPEHPQVTMGFISEDLATMKRFLESPAWTNILQRLSFYIQDYRHKVIHAQGGFQL